jgi:hypothetical protein
MILTKLPGRGTRGAQGKIAIQMKYGKRRFFLLAS